MLELKCPRARLCGMLLHLPLQDWGWGRESCLEVWLRPDWLCVSAGLELLPPPPTPPSARTRVSTDPGQSGQHLVWRSGRRKLKWKFGVTCLQQPFVREMEYNYRWDGRKQEGKGGEGERGGREGRERAQSIAIFFISSLLFFSPLFLFSFPSPSSSSSSFPPLPLPFPQYQNYGDIFKLLTVGHERGVIRHPWQLLIPSSGMSSVISRLWKLTRRVVCCLAKWQ